MVGSLQRGWFESCRALRDAPPWHHSRWRRVWDEVITYAQYYAQYDVLLPYNCEPTAKPDPLMMEAKKRNVKKI